MADFFSHTRYDEFVEGSRELLLEALYHGRKVAAALDADDVHLDGQIVVERGAYRATIPFHGARHVNEEVIEPVDLDDDEAEEGAEEGPLPDGEAVDGYDPAIVRAALDLAVAAAKVHEQPDKIVERARAFREFLAEGRD